MKLPIYQVDAFADQLFGGNPAAIVPLEDWLDDAVMMAIAAENNLSETAFFRPQGDKFGLRWFSPTVEIPLCGHATLASAHVLLRHRGYAGDKITFSTRSGDLFVKAREDGWIEMDFPARPTRPIPIPDALSDALGAVPIAVHKGEMTIALFADAGKVRALRPNFAKLAALSANEEDGGIIVTAPGEGASDFVSRFFAPHHGIDEDPVTGSAHCALAPFWSEKLARNALTGRQISKRGGTVRCENRGDRIGLIGRCVDYLTGEITV